MTQKTQELTEILDSLDAIETFVASMKRCRDNVSYMAEDLSEPRPILCRPEVLRTMSEILTEKIADVSDNIRKAREATMHMLH